MFCYCCCLWLNIGILQSLQVNSCYLRDHSLLSQVYAGRQGHHTLLRCLMFAEECLETYDLSSLLNKFSSSVCSQPNHCLHLSCMKKSLYIRMLPVCTSCPHTSSLTLKRNLNIQGERVAVKSRVFHNLERVVIAVAVLVNCFAKETAIQGPCAMNCCAYNCV